MERILEQSLLFDFYGELLTEHQRRIYEEVVMDDCSLGEVAESEGISRQGVHDIVKRADRTMQGYEEKLKLVERYLSIKERIKKIDEDLSALEGPKVMEIKEELESITELL